MVPAGSLAKASSVGAKTVKGPAVFMVSARPAAPRAAARVLKAPEPIVSAMSAFFSTVTEEESRFPSSYHEDTAFTVPERVVWDEGEVGGSVMGARKAAAPVLIVSASMARMNATEVIVCRIDES